MRFPIFQHFSGGLSSLVIALTWLVLISILHVHLNSEPKASNMVQMGYMPVFTNLAAPLVDFASKGSAVSFRAIKFGSFAEMAEAFKSGHIQVAFIIAPLAVVLHLQNIPLKVVYIGNRNESTLVVRNDLPYRSLSEMVGTTIAVPIRYSGHLLALNRYLREHGLAPKSIRTVEIPPSDMPSALAAGTIDGYFVGEPFAGKAIQAGTGRKLLYVEDIWPNFICNLVIVRDELIRSNPEWVQALVTASIRSCLYAQDHFEEAAEIVNRYWRQPPELASFVFLNPPGRMRFDLYVPKLEELEEIVSEMQDAGLIEGRIDLREMLEPRFALSADTEPAASFRDIMLK